MRCPVFVGDAVTKLFSFAIALTIVLSSASTMLSQAGTSQVEQIDANSIIIAMDNVRQGDTDGSGGCSGPDFNIRAYGLAVHLLHANIPLKWSIKDKATKDEADFVADVTQLIGDIGGGINVGGQDCTTETANTPFAGGPLIIPAQYRDAALQVIEDFNDGPSDSNDVRVYNVNANFVAPIRYTLTHKPFVAVGPDGGGFGGTVYETLFAAAGLVDDVHYDQVANVDFASECVTLAAQAHASNDAINFIDDYRAHTESGGNLLLQCRSVNVFENALPPSGRFQTTLGWTTFGDSGGEVDEVITTFPNPAMAFNQFVGNLGDARGNVSEYQLAASSVFQNGTLIAARNNSSGNTNKYVATVSRIGSATAGGNVFELGGHEYSSTTNTDGGALARANGNRMALNTLLVPATKPGCNLSINSVQAFKSVAMFNDINGNTLPNFGDTVEWTIRYINDGVGTITNFQITDSLDTLPAPPPGPSNRLAYVAGSLSVSVNGVGTSAVGSGSYSPNADLVMLEPGATLAPGGMITVKIRTVVQGFGTILNQATGSGTGLNTPVLTDTTDATTSGNVAGYPIACPGTCLPQNVYSAPGTNQDPTGIDLGAVPTAAGVDVGGFVSDQYGRGVAREQVVLQSAATGEVRFAATNTFGRFMFRDVEVGNFYIVSVLSKRHVYQTSSYSFDLVDSLTDIEFVAQAPGSGRLPGGGSKTVATSTSVPAVSETAPSAPAKALSAPRRTIILGPARKKADDKSDDDDQ